MLKTQQWLVEPNSRDSIVAKFLWLALAGCELLLAVWLMIGLWPILSLRITAVCFLCFAVISFWKISQGIQSCGCFGNLEISPEGSYWIDVGAFLLGCWSLRLEQKTLPIGGSWRFNLIFVVWLIIALGFYGTGLVLARNTDADPSHWIGWSWPPAGAVNIPADLSQGRWVVLLYDSSCGHCRVKADDYAAQADLWQSQGKKIRVALVDAGREAPVTQTSSDSDLVRGALQNPKLYH